ncbi:MAG TPA: glutathione S-transferase C-terminal domain-containing protein, partial [Polyangiaceae bacterium]|nr:glutathione S-transferase C-terminal domain-containing protein [Polyangiaceae bacterium]
LARIWIDFANTRLAAAFTKVLWGATDAERDAGRGELTSALERIEGEALAQLSGAGPYWFGAEPTLVDFAFYPWFERLPAFQEHTGLELPRGLERLGRWREAVSQRSSVLEIANPTAFYLERYRSYRRPAPSPQPARAKAS